MADPTPGLPGGQALADQLAHNVADGAAHNQQTIDGLQHSLAEGQANIMNSLASNQASLDAGWAQEAQRAQGLDAVFNSLNGPTPGIVPGLTPGFEAQGPHMDGLAPQPQMQVADGHAPMIDGQHPPMMDAEAMPMMDGQTPGLQVQQSLHHDGEGDGDGDVIESLLGFDLDGDDDVGDAHAAGDVHDINDAIQLAHDTGQVVVIEEVIVIDPGQSPDMESHDHHGGDFSA